MASKSPVFFPPESEDVVAHQLLAPEPSDADSDGSYEHCRIDEPSVFGRTALCLDGGGRFAF